MGDQNTGGGGSVLWSVAASRPVEDLKGTLNKVSKALLKGQTKIEREVVSETAYSRTTKADKSYITEGADAGAKVGQQFTVTVKFNSREGLEKTFKWDKNAKTFTFKLPIANNPSQIHIHWPDGVSKK